MELIKDINGSILNGAKKDSLGTIVIRNDSEYRKYIHAKEQTEKINKLCKDVEELKIMVKILNEQVNNQKYK